MRVNDSACDTLVAPHIIYEERNMKIGKYITNFGVITSILGVLAVFRQTKEMPGDVRRYLMWAVWLCGVALAVIGVKKDHEESQ